jgi:predicted Holliday junction resolvase-like endonuclease
MKETIRLKGEAAENDDQIHEELAQNIVNSLSVEDYLTQNEEWKAAEQLHEVAELMIEHSPDSVRRRAKEINNEKED